MVLKVSADTLVLDSALDSCGFEHIRVTDAGQLEKLRTLNDASAQNHFTSSMDAVLLTIVDELDAFGGGAVE